MPSGSDPELTHRGSNVTTGSRMGVRIDKIDEFLSQEANSLSGGVRIDKIDKIDEISTISALLDPF